MRELARAPQRARPANRRGAGFGRRPCLGSAGARSEAVFAFSRRGAAIQVSDERLAFRRKRAWRMNTAPTAMTSQSQTLKPSSTPSAMVRMMIKVNAAMNAQFLKRESGSATSSHPLVYPVELL
jgi:hypothetical protein